MLQIANALTTRIVPTLYRMPSPFVHHNPEDSGVALSESAFQEFKKEIRKIERDIA